MGIRFRRSLAATTMRAAIMQAPAVKIRMSARTAGIRSHDQVTGSPVASTMMYITAIAGSRLMISETDTEVGSTARGSCNDRTTLMLLGIDVARAESVEAIERKRNIAIVGKATKWSTTRHIFKIRQSKT